MLTFLDPSPPKKNGYQIKDGLKNLSQKHISFEHKFKIPGQFFSMFTPRSSNYNVTKLLKKKKKTVIILSKKLIPKNTSPKTKSKFLDNFFA